MSNLAVAPYGSWRLPITLDMVAHGTVNLMRIALGGPDTCWAEVRLAEEGRTVLGDGTRRPSGGPGRVGDQGVERLGSLELADAAQRLSPLGSGLYDSGETW